MMENSFDRKRIAFFLVILIMLIFSGCSSTPAGDAVLDKGDTSLCDVKEKGVLVIGTYASFPPSVFIDENGEYAGYDMDVAKEITKKLGVKVEIKNIFFPELFTALDNRDIDIVISGVTITQKRQENYLFSIPYFNAGIVIVAGEDKLEKEINNLDDLDGKVVGVLKGTTGESLALSSIHVNKSLLKVFDKKEDGLDFALAKGDIDAALEDYPAIIPLVKKYPWLSVKSGFLTDDYYGVMARKDDGKLIEEINAILRDLRRSGKLEELRLKWME